MIFIDIMNISFITPDYIDISFKKISSNHHLHKEQTEANPSTINDVTAVFLNGACITLMVGSIRSSQGVIDLRV